MARKSDIRVGSTLIWLNYHEGRSNRVEMKITAIKCLGKDFYEMDDIPEEYHKYADICCGELRLPLEEAEQCDSIL